MFHLWLNVPVFDIIFEDDDLLVINKPAGLVCHPTKNGEMSSLIGRARLHLLSTINSQPSTFPSPVTRHEPLSPVSWPSIHHPSSIIQSVDRTW